MEIAPETRTWNSLYKILIGSVVPRPIGWISSVDAAGRPNLAPYSFFNAVCANPPHVLFCPMIRSTTRRPKDSLSNVRETGEFVVNIVTASLAEQMNLSAIEAPADLNEFEFAGLEMAPSVVVRPPRVAASPIHFECRLAQIVDLGDEPGSGSVVIGRVVHIHIREDVLIGEDKIDVQRLQPIARLAGNYYTHLGEIFEMARPAPLI